MGSTLIHGATVLSVDAENTVFEGGYVAIRDGRISAIGPNDGTPDPSDFDEAFALPGHLVMPGLVNAHTHSAMVLFRGRSEGQSLLTMEGWYNSIREPELSLVSSDIGPAVALSCAEMALSGTTTFCDQYFFAEEIAEVEVFFRAAGVGVELDGGGAHQTTRNFHSDRRKDRRLRAIHRVEMVRVTRLDLDARPDELARDLWAMVGAPG